MFLRWLWGGRGIGRRGGVSKGSDVEGGTKRGGDGDIICPKVFRGKFRSGVVIRLGGWADVSDEDRMSGL